MKQASDPSALPPDMTPVTIARHLVNLVWQSTFSTAWATLVAESRSDVYDSFTALALGLAGYRHDRGAYPARLAELCPAYVAEMPLDLFGDGDFRYRREDDGYLVYSIGPNGKDDGGRNYMQDNEHWYEDESATEEEKSWDDIAIRTPPKESAKK